MKTYNMPVFVSEWNGSAFEYVKKNIAVNVPTRSQVQAKTESPDFPDCQVIISNFGPEDFAVAKFERNTNPNMIRHGFLFETKAKPENVYTLKGKTARADAIALAAALVAGRDF